MQGYDIIIKSAATRDGKAGHGWNGFYIFENGSYVLSTSFRSLKSDLFVSRYQYLKAAQEIGKALKENKVAETDEVKPFSKEEAKETYGGELMVRWVRMPFC